VNQKELTKKLQTLKTIEPNEEFVRVSRSVILSSKTGIPVNQVKQGIFSRGLSFALSVTLTAMFLLVLALGNNAGPFKTFFLPTLPGVGTDNLVSEADTITNDIDIKLDEIKYFEQTRRTVALANDNVAFDPSSDVLSDGEDEIDKLLEEVIEY